MVRSFLLQSLVREGDSWRWRLNLELLDRDLGELRGFPATPGTSEVWRVEAGSEDAVCDPENPAVGDCTLNI